MFLDYSTNRILQTTLYYYMRIYVYVCMLYLKKNYTHMPTLGNLPCTTSFRSWFTVGDNMATPVATERKGNNKDSYLLNCHLISC